MQIAIIQTEAADFVKINICVILKTFGHDCTEPEMPRPGKVERRIWWFTVSKAVDRSRRMRTEDRDLALAVRRAFVTQRRAVSLGWVTLFEAWLVRVKNIVLREITRGLVRDCTLKCFVKRKKEGIPVCSFLCQRTLVLFSRGEERLEPFWSKRRHSQWSGMSWWGMWETHHWEGD
jgi:hypothetical protein